MADALKCLLGFSIVKTLSQIAWGFPRVPTRVRCVSILYCQLWAAAAAGGGGGDGGDGGQTYRHCTVEAIWVGQ